MKLKDDRATADKIMHTWSNYWAKFSDEKQAIGIIKHFEGEDADHIDTAVQQHLEDYRIGTNGTRIGTFPPSIADINGRLAQMREQNAADKKARETAKKYLEETPENQSRAAATFERLDWRALTGQHQDKRDAIIAYLRQTQRLDFSQGIDREAFRPVQAALYDTNSELTPEDAAEIFRAARLPDASWTEVEEKRAKEFSKDQWSRAVELARARWPWRKIRSGRAELREG